MTCQEADALVDAYVDGELTGGEREAYDQHLLKCDRCARACRVQGALKATLRRQLTRPAVPASCRARIQESLAREAARSGGRSPWRTWSFRLLPAAAIATVVVFALRPRAEPPVLEEAQRTYAGVNRLPLDVLGPDCRLVTTWFRDRLGFPVRVLPLGGSPPTCKGGRLVQVRTKPAAHLVYQVRAGDGAGEGADQLVSVLIFDARNELIEAQRRRLLNDREVYFSTGPGISTAVYRDRGLGYAVTADLDEETLSAMLRSALGKGGGLQAPSRAGLGAPTH